MQEVKHTKEFLMLKEKVRMMFNKMENEIDQLEFIDVLQRLGVAYQSIYLLTIPEKKVPPFFHFCP